MSKPNLFVYSNILCGHETLRSSLDLGLSPSEFACARTDFHMLISSFIGEIACFLQSSNVLPLVNFSSEKDQHLLLERFEAAASWLRLLFLDAMNFIIDRFTGAWLARSERLCTVLNDHTEMTEMNLLHD